MDEPDIYDPENLGRRQQMAAARRQRESERLAFLGQLIDAQRRANELRGWISAYAHPECSCPALQRMIAWATSQIDDLERILSSERIAATLIERELFPEVDPLNDPKGEPPSHRIWGHSTALRHINAV